MSLLNEYLELFTQIANRIPLPKIKSVYLPESDRLVDGIKKKDEFGFVVLDDDSVGAFYTSFDNTLECLEKRYPDNLHLNLDSLSVIKHITGSSLPMRAIALGTINAVSQHIMKRAKFTTPDKKTTNSQSTGISQAKAGERIGMIGYFAPLIERLLGKDIEILVLEKDPKRVEPQQGVTVSERIADLAQCDHILCTASTLINDTLDEILQHSTLAKTFSLIGPTGSSLPDLLFKHGVNAVGGFHFHDLPALQQALSSNESWGHAGKKYQITPDRYPGIYALLKKF